MKIFFIFGFELKYQKKTSTILTNAENQASRKPFFYCTTIQLMFRKLAPGDKCKILRIETTIERTKHNKAIKKIHFNAVIR